MVVAWHGGAEGDVKVVVNAADNRAAMDEFVDNKYLPACESFIYHGLCDGASKRARAKKSKKQRARILKG